MKQLLLFCLALLTLPSWVAGRVYPNTIDLEVNGLLISLQPWNLEASVVKGENYYKTLFGDIQVPATVSYEGEEYRVVEIGCGAFCACPDITSITLPEGIRKINPNAFELCSSLAHVNLPSSVRDVHSNILLGTKWLEEQADGLLCLDNVLLGWKGEMPAGTHVDIPEGTRVVANSALDGIGLRPKSVSVPESVEYLPMHSLGSSLDSVYMNVKSVGDGWFAFLSNLHKVAFGPSVRRIENGAFIYSDRVHSVYTSGNIEYIGSENSLFNNLLLPSEDGMCYIDKVAYRFVGEAAGQTEVSLRAGIKSVGPYAFRNCRKLTSVKVPEEVEYIGYEAFQCCSSLTSVSLPASLRQLETYAFDSCVSLRSIVLPSSLSTLYDSAFEGCTSVVDVISLAPEPPRLTSDYALYSSVFDKSWAEQCTLYVPLGSKPRYEDDPRLRACFMDIVELDVSGISAPPASVSPPFFDLSGRRLSAPPARGIYIEDGQKRVARSR